jgi:hypothetical protein
MSFIVGAQVQCLGMGTGVNTCFQNDETDSLVIQGYFLRGEGEGLWKTKTGNTKAPKITNVN